MLRIDDILAAVLLSIIMLRRLETIGYRLEDNRHLPAGAFEYWKKAALRAYNVGALACTLKVAVNLAWLRLAGSSPTLLRIGGLVVFVAWVGALMWTWRQTTEARAQRIQLGIRARGEPA